MAKKTLSFDATEVTTNARTNDYLHVEIETNYPSEVINEFDSDEIISEYEDLDKLYEALKEHFGDVS